MANTGTDYFDPADDPLVPGQELMRSRPLGDVTGMVNPSFTGITGVVSPGIWDGADVSGVGFVPGLAGTKKVLGGAAKRIGGALENLTADPNIAPDESKNQPPAPEVSPAVDDQARTRNALPDILAGGQPPAGSLADKLVKTTKEGAIGGRVLNGPYDEARSGDNPGATASTELGGDAARPPTQDQPNEGFRPGTGLPGMLGRLFDNLSSWRDQNRLTLLALAGGLAGSQSIGQGIGRGLTAAAAAQPQQFAMNNQNATMQALVSRGLPPDIARAAAGNPAILQELLPRAFGAKQQKFTQVGHDQYGQPTYGFVDEVNGKVYDLAGKEVTQGSSNGIGQDVMQMHGEQFLQTLDPARAAQIRSIGQGKQPFPSGMMLKTPFGQMLSQQITQAYPDLNSQTFPARQKAWNDWYGGGKHADAMGSIRQAANHGFDLVAGDPQNNGAGSFDSLNNLPGGRVVNAPLNIAGEALGIGSSGAHLDTLKLNAHALADELSSIWKGAGHNSDAEIRAWEESIPVNGTKEQQRNWVAKAVDLYKGGIAKLESLRRDEFGPVSDTLPSVVDPETAAHIQAMDDWAHGRPINRGAQQPQQQAAPQQPIRIQSEQQWMALPKGTPYIDPNGNPRTKQ